jgi:hypothetical protein
MINLGELELQYGIVDQMFMENVDFLETNVT